jgi:hypothetical protein
VNALEIEVKRKEKLGAGTGPKFVWVVGEAGAGLYRAFYHRFIVRHVKSHNAGRTMAEFGAVWSLFPFGKPASFFCSRTKTVFI